MQHTRTVAWVVFGMVAAAGCSTQIGGVADGGGDGGNSGGGVGGGSAGRAGGTGGGSAGRAGGTGGTTTGTGGRAAGTGGRAAGVGGAAGASTGLGGAGGGSTNGGCALFTPDDPWNADVSAKPVNTNWTTKVHALLGNVNIHPDFGSDFGIPINTVPSTQPTLPITFDQFGDESDPGPYPFPPPATAIIEGASPTNCDGDCHMIVVKLGVCQLYEGYACRYSNGWVCGNGAHWDLTRRSLGQRPDGWTSADAAGLSIYAGLARYAEYAAGEITHAIRFTLPCTTNSRVSPATHTAATCNGNVNAPPMGLRMRLNASFDISSYAPTAQAFLRAFKRYGLILADNGGSSSTFFFQSETDSRWNDDEINDLKRVPVSAFEAVDP